MPRQCLLYPFLFGLLAAIVVSPTGAAACAEGQQLTISGTIGLLEVDSGGYPTILGDGVEPECANILKLFSGVPPQCAEGGSFSATGQLQELYPGASLYHFIVSELTCW